MNAYTKHARLTIAVLLICTAWSMHFARAEEVAGPGCTESAVDSDRSEAGPACSAVIDDASATPANRVAALLMRGVWHYRAKRFADAKRDIEHGLRLDPEQPKLLQLLADLYLDFNDDATAEQLAKRSAEIDPNRSTTFQILADVAARKGDHLTALGYLNRAVELRADNAMARFKRARTLLELNRASGALSDTSWLIAQPVHKVDRAGSYWIDDRFVPLHLSSRILHGQVLQALERFEQAESEFNAIVANDRTAFTLTQRSHFLHGLPIGAGMSSRLQEAMADAKEAVRLDPRDARAHRQYASTLEYAKRPAEALAEIDLALEFEKTEWGIPALLWNRARLLRVLGRQDEAIEFAKKSLLIAHKFAPVYFGERMRRLERLGYWRPPASFPNTFEAALSDAVTACMVDESCW